MICIESDAFAPGLASLAVARPKTANIVLTDPLPKRDGMGLHRKADPGTGAFTAHHGASFVTTEAISAGSELYIEPTEEQIEKRKFNNPESTVSPNWLTKNGVCIDDLRVGPSTIKQAGRGAFAKRMLPRGSIIAPSTLAVIKRDDLIIFEADEAATHYEKVLNKNKVLGHELILNYCIGHPDSPLLFLPLSPVVNFLDHNRTEANAEFRWPSDPKLIDG
jgi:hypothetical protein